MRNLVAGLLGLLLAGGLVAHGAGLADARGLNPAPVIPAVEGGIAPAVALAAQGVVVPPALEDIEEMCALLLGCPEVPLVPPKRDFGECVAYVQSTLSSAEGLKFSVPLRECGLQSNSCKELRECALRGASQDSCKGRGKGKAVGFCDDEGRALTCLNEKLVQIRDCPRFGEQCSARQGQATCTLGDCPADLPADGTPTCSPNGQKIFSCDRGKLVSMDCSAFGLSCVKHEGKITCAAGAAPACDGKSAPHCKDDEQVSCVSGHEVKVQCGKSGMKCATGADPGAIGACVAPPSDAGTCNPKAPAKCDGTSIEYCIGGKTRSYFCKGLGFSKCGGKTGQVSCLP
ncbi:MAG: hypothetical protein MUF64_19710 [Polyangiaceae bacterium]|jgi:hypothetical protein|nr:hypothetical protein [Polyangiaceae bacterium]